MRNLSAALVAALLVLVAPHAGAWGADDEPLTLRVPTFRVGDKLLYVANEPGAHAVSLQEAEEKAPERHETVVLVEGPGAAVDRYGVVRDVDTYRFEFYGDGEPYGASRCHQLRGGVESVRVDHVSGRRLGGGGHFSMEFPLVGGSSTYSNATPITTFDGTPCVQGLTLGGRSLSEGDMLSFGDFAHQPYANSDARSRPAYATSFHGRDALVFEFDLGAVYPTSQGHGGVAAFVVADGLPGIVRAEFRGSGMGEPYVRELAGIEEGTGDATQPQTGARLPERNPDARFVTVPRTGLDDAALGLPFPYAEAFKAVEESPTSGLRAWMENHPDAWLGMAAWFRSDDASSSTRVESDGGWHLSLRDHASEYSVTVSRYGGVHTPAGPVAAPAKVDHVWSGSERRLEDPERMAPPPDVVADSATLRALLEANGARMEAIESMFLFTYPDGDRTRSVLVVATNLLRVDTSGGEGHAEGWQHHLDLESGGLLAVHTTSTETRTSDGLLAPPASGSLARGEKMGALAFLAGPGVGSGLAVSGAAATGIALLVVLLKLVAIPLFTRLRRDRLLDNPVRARLYERIRAEPGIHLAELVDYSGLGKGATKHHLDQLVKHRLLVEAQEEGFTRYFASGEVPPDVARREMVLRAGATREVYDLLAAHPGMSLREAAARLGIAAPTVHRYRKRLEKAGLLPAAPRAEVRATEA